MTASATISPTSGPSITGPRIRLAPDSGFSVGPAAIEVAARAGLILDPWEEDVLVDALGERPDGKWAAFEVATVVPRQNGKDAILEARELTGMFVLEEDLIIHSAHEQATASDHFRRLLNLIEGVPEFEQRVMKVVRGKGSEAIELRGGARIFFKTRTGGGGRGLGGTLVILNEAMILPASTMAALVPVMAARSVKGNPQLWYAGSAVDEEKHEHGLVLAGVRERAIKGSSKRLAYVEYSADVGDPSEDDPAKVTDTVRRDQRAWAQGNPGLDIRISREYVTNEEEALGAREFCVERLGIGAWPDTSAEVGRVISAEVWAACAELDRANRITSTPTFAVDVNPDQTWGSIGIGGRRDDKLYQVAVVEHERGTDWIVPTCVDLQQQNRKAKFVVDKRGPAAFLIEPLKKAKVKVIEASTEDYGRAFGGFIAEVDEVEHSTSGRPKGLRYPAPQPDLDDALASARKAPMGDAHKWSRKNSTSADITPLVAVTLALWGAKTLKARPQVVDLNAALADAES